MTDQEWVAGYSKLAVAFPDRDMTVERVRARGDVYREHLDDLNAQAWAYAVNESIREERWFPTIAALRDYASEYREPELYLPPQRRTEEEKEQARMDAKKGLELIRQAVEAAEIKISAPLVKEMP